MFQINYRIILNIEDLNEINDLSGFFELVFNDWHYGVYHDQKLTTWDLECEDELITVWFRTLIQACLKLEKSDYVAINNFETDNWWIELCKTDQNKLLVSEMEYHKPNGTFLILKEKPDQSQYCYTEWNDIEISYREFKHEIIKKGKAYFEEMRAINPLLLKYSSISNVVSLLEKLEIAGEPEMCDTGEE